MNKEEQKKLLTEIMEADAKDGLYHIVDTNKMVRAVEWLFTQLYEKFEMKGDGEKMNEILNKAIEMEKEHIINAYESGWVNGDLKKSPRFGEDYYNANFNNQTNQ
jgi:hypothetical protein